MQFLNEIHKKYFLYVKNKDIIKMAKNHLAILTQMCTEI